MPYSEREALKYDAWQTYVKATTMGERVIAYEMKMRAHYERSLESARKTKAHPDFYAYACHYILSDCLRAQQKHGIHVVCIPWADETTENLVALTKALIRKYPNPRWLAIKPGSSYWGFDENIGKTGPRSKSKTSRKDTRSIVVTKLEHEVALLKLKLILAERQGGTNESNCKDV